MLIKLRLVGFGMEMFIILAMGELELEAALEKKLLLIDFLLKFTKDPFQKDFLFFTPVILKNVLIQNIFMLKTIKVG